MLALAALAGPRLGVVVWWLFDQQRWAASFHSMWVWPILGFLFLPWTTLAFVFAAPAGVVSGWGWLVVIIGLLIDPGSAGGAGQSRRRRSSSR